eukprot:TRINITY_DN77737_c0_g1_i1.p1 TRINITY_DN77737_c0_g1~~TRINITY_DN77737_c0_g1_i1.p1  ORF type:complete len:861 (-),score=165.24 TRINITY_DN77737_c0_g1_i1:159-2741(-)
MSEDNADALEGLDNLDITSCKEEINKLQAERERRRELTERLQEKLKALNNELAARKEEADRCRKELLEEQARNRRLQQERRDRDSSKKEISAIRDEAQREEEEAHQVANIRRFMEQHLHEKLEKGINRNEYGVRIFDEVELMVEKSAEEQEKESTYIDTVLVTYSVPNTELKYNLSFRVDRNMTSQKLREDACLYWGLSEVEFILKTISNAKVHDELTIQNCFRAEEDAHFILQQKTPKNTGLMPEELGNIRPLIGKKARLKATTKTGQTGDSAAAAGGAGDLAAQMAELPGLFEFMTQRDQQVIGHLLQTKLRSICVYAILSILSPMVFFMLRPSGVGYTCMTGVSDLLTGSATGFHEMQTPNELWSWLNHTLSPQLFVEGSELRQYNYATGYLQLRMQQVKEASSSACPKGVELPQDHSACTHLQYNKDTAGTEDLQYVKSYWLGRQGQDGRGFDREPWSYTDIASADGDKDKRSVRGTRFTFDSSGYAAEYNMQYAPISQVKAAFEEDIAFFQRSGWINSRTRAVHVQFLLYNGNYDRWIDNRFTFEITALGVNPSKDIDLFLPRLFEWGLQSEGFLQTVDIVRLLLVLYVMFYQPFADMGFHRRLYQGQEYPGIKAFWRTVLTIQTPVDLTIGITFFAVYATRYGAQSSVETGSFLAGHLESFRLAARYADMSSAQVVAEALIYILVLYRLLFFMRVNRQVFLIYTAVQRSASAAMSYIGVILPIMLAFVTVSLSINDRYYASYRTFGHAFTQLIVLLYGDDEGFREYDPNRSWELSFKIIFYTLSRLIFINTWFAVLINTYQKVRVTAGFFPSTYAWKEYNYVMWCLPWPFRNLYLNFVRPRIKKPPKASGEDDS